MARPHPKGFASRHSQAQYVFEIHITLYDGVDYCDGFEHPFHMVIGHCVFGH